MPDSGPQHLLDQVARHRVEQKGRERSSCTSSRCLRSSWRYVCHKKQRADLRGVKNQMKLVSGRLEQQEGQREQEERAQRVKAQAMAREPGQEVGRPRAE